MSRETAPPRSALLLATGVEAGADPFDVGNEVAADLVHDVVAEALEEAHHRLGLSEQPALLVGHEALEPVVARPFPAEHPTELADGVPRHVAEVVAERRELALESLREVRPQPGMRLEFEGMGGLVEGDPRPERVERHVERAGGCPDVLLDEEGPPGSRLGRQEGEVVLAEDALAHEAEQEANAG